MERADQLRKKLQAKLQDSKEKKQQEIQSQLDESISRLNTLDDKACAFYKAGNMKESAKGYQAVLLAVAQVKALIEQAKKVGLNIEKTSIDDTLVNAHFILGITYFNMRDFPQASHYLNKSQTQNKEYKYYQIMNYLGAINLEQGNFEVAEKYLREAIKSPEQDQYCCAAYLNLAKCLLDDKLKPTTQEKDIPTIITYGLKALHFLPIGTNLFLGNLYLKQGDIDKAILYYKAAADLGSSKAFEQLGSIHYFEEYGINNPELALVFFEKGGDLGDSNAAYNAACLYDEGKLIARNPEKALFWYRKAAEKKHPPALHNLGQMYLKGEDVKKDEEEAFKLFTEASTLNYVLSINTMGNCLGAGLGVKKNLDEAIICYSRAYKMGNIQAGQNLATIYYNQSKTAADSSLKKEAFDKAAAIWQALTEKKHAISFFNLGCSYGKMAGILLFFEQAEFNYQQAGLLGYSPAYTNLAILYLEEFLKSKDKKNTELLKKFKDAVEQGLQLGNKEAQLIYDSYLSDGEDYQLVLEKIKGTHHKIHVENNQDIMDLACKIDLTPEERIVKIATMTLNSERDGINLSTAIHLIGKLFQQSGFNPNFLKLNIDKVLNLVWLAVGDARHLNLWSLVNILTGLSGLNIDPIQYNVKLAFEMLCQKVLEYKIENFSLKQNLLIIQAAARFGTKHPSILAVANEAINSLKEASLSTEEAAQFLYNLALLENDWQVRVKDTKLLFDEKIYQKILTEIPPAQELNEIAQVNQLYMGLFYFTEVRKLKTFHEEKSKGYLSAETIERIKQGSKVAEGQKSEKNESEKNESGKSGLQSHVAYHLKKIFPKLIEEHFISTLPVDIFIEGVGIVQVDGPRHFLFNYESGQKSRTPKDLLVGTILEQSLIKQLHIPYDDWQSAVAKNKVSDYLREQFSSIGYQLAEAPKITHQYNSKININSRNLESNQISITGQNKTTFSKGGKSVGPT